MANRKENALTVNRALEVLTVNQKWNGSFGPDKRLKKNFDKLQSFVLDNETQGDFSSLLGIIQQKAIWWKTDRERKQQDKGRKERKDYSESLKQYGGTFLTNRSSLIDYFPDIDQPQSYTNRTTSKFIPNGFDCGIFGISSMTELEELFIPSHFDIKSIDSQPTEIKWLVRNHTEASKLINKLRQEGISMFLHKMRQTPETTLAAIKIISDDHQHNWLINWLPQMIKDNKQVKINMTLSPKINGDSQYTDNEAFKIAQSLLRSSEFIKKYFKSINISSENALRIVGITDNKMTKEQKHDIDRLNQLLDPLRKEYASRKVLHDYYSERFYFITGMFRTFAILGLATDVLENVFKLPRLAISFAASSDDVTTEGLEFGSLVAQGIKLEELILRRLPLLIIGASAAIYLSYFKVQDLLNQNEILEAGTTYGVSAVMLSFVTILQSIGIFKERLDKLIEEGKAEDMSQLERLKFASKADFNNPLRKGVLSGVIASPVLSAIASGLGLFHFPLLLPLFGQSEQIGGAITSAITEKTFESSWTQFCRNYITSTS